MTPRASRASTAIIGAVGALVISAAVAGLFEIESRAGPYELQIVPFDLNYRATGSYAARAPEGTVGPAGLCLPDAPGGQCAAARLDIELRFTGLPPLAPGSQYWAFLRDDADVLPLEPLSAEGDAHVLRVSEERDARGFDQLLVALETTPAPTTPGPWVLYTKDVSSPSDAPPLDLAEPRQARLVTGDGNVRAAEIGGIHIASTAVGDLAAPNPPAGWVYHAWFEPRSPGDGVTDLGTWTRSGPNRWALEARMEGVALETLSRFITTMQPESTPDALQGPVVFTAT